MTLPEGGKKRPRARKNVGTFIIMGRRQAWAIDLEHGQFAGILFFGLEPAAHIAGGRTALWRTRQEARAAWKAKFKPLGKDVYRGWPNAKVVRVFVHITEATNV